MAKRPQRQRGYALLIMVVILVMGSLYTIVSQLDAVQMKFKQVRITDESLKLAREALIKYAATYGDDPQHSTPLFGYLPCPDTAEKSGLFQPGDGTASASCGNADQVAIGLLPYRTLGLPDLRDADGNCLWYAVSGTFKNAPPPTTPLNWDTEGQLSVLGASGATLSAPDNPSASPPYANADGGVAAIVFAPGLAINTSQAQGRSGSNQPCNANPANIAAYLESSANSFVTGIAKDGSGAITNNDRVAWITPRDIFSRILARPDFRNPLGSYPEGQINRLIDASRRAVESRLWTNMAALTAASSGTPGIAAAPANQANYTQFPGKLIGDLPNLKPLSYTGASYDNVFDNWQDQFRYVVCDDLKPGSGCLTLGAQPCRGVLLLGGQSRTDAPPFGGPRPSWQKTPRSSAVLANYFESGGGLDLLNSAATTFGGASWYADTMRSADVGVCLSPGAYSTFAKDIAAYSAVATSALTPQVAIDTAAAIITLGNQAATAAGSGCAWFPTQLPFNSSLRVYFKLNIVEIGEGFVFAVADGPKNLAAMNNGTMCGSTTSSLLGYSSANLSPPKFGLEIDTRVQGTANCTGSNRNDPGANHMAFVYWGTAASASDDNCHNAGTLGSGSAPLNPRTLTTSSITPAINVATVTAVSWAGNVATVTTAAAHGLAANQQVTVSGIAPAAYNGTYAGTVIDATHFAYSLANNPGAYVSGGTVTKMAGIKNVQASDPHLPYAGTLPLHTDIHVRLDVNKAFDAALVRSASWSSPANAASIATAAAHGLLTNQRVTISGVNPPAYNGTYTIAVADTTHFTFGLGADPGNYVSGGRITPPLGVAIAAASWSAPDHAATIATASAHGFASGQPVSISGVTPAAYNGTYQIAVVDPTHFTYALGTNPGAYSTGGILAPAVALSLKAYVASNLEVVSGSYISTCDSSDIRNLAADLSDLCTQNPAIEQDNVYMDSDAVTGQALAAVYSGFTNAQGTGAASKQTVTISNFAIKTQ